MVIYYGFIKKALYAHVTPKFAQIKGQFVNNKEKHEAKRRLMLSHVSKHWKYCKETTKEHHEISGKLMTIFRENIVVIPGDKDSTIGIMDRNDYVKKILKMIEKEIQEGVFVKTEDSTLQNQLKQFQDFLYRNFSKYEKYDDMLPSSDQPAQLHGTAKTC